MILADTLAEELRNYQGVDGSIGRARSLLDLAPKFVFEQHTARLAAGAAALPGDVAARVPVPEAICWMEFHSDGLRCGFLTIAEDDSLRHCRCVIARRLDGAKELTLSTDLLDMDGGGLQVHSSLNPMLIGALALLGAPALIEKRKRSLERLNRSRAKTDKPLLYDHEEVRLHELDLARPASGAHGEAQSYTGSRRRQRQHFRRAFLRFRLGQMELVRPHWRGDATLGTVNPAYRVRVA